MDNTQCLENYNNISIGQYYINIDLSFTVQQITCYQNQREILFSNTRKCINNFISNITSVNKTYYPYITSYSYLPQYEYDNDFFDDKSEINEYYFYFNFIIYDNVDNSTFVYDHTADQYKHAIKMFTKCNLLLSQKLILKDLEIYQIQ